MNDYRYLIDNNALSKLSPTQRVSEFLQNNCRIPSEVLYEARWFDDLDQLKDLEYPISAGVLEALTEVMATIPASDTKLVDLYANRGNADPLLVACALDAQRIEAQYLIGPTWVIVSDDNAVRAKATEFGFEIRSAAEFLVLVG